MNLCLIKNELLFERAPLYFKLNVTVSLQQSLRSRLQNFCSILRGVHQRDQIPPLRPRNDPSFKTVLRSDPAFAQIGSGLTLSGFSEVLRQLVQAGLAHRYQQSRR